MLKRGTVIILHHPRLEDLDHTPGGGGFLNFNELLGISKTHPMAARARYLLRRLYFLASLRRSTGEKSRGSCKQIKYIC